MELFAGTVHAGEHVHGLPVSDIAQEVDSCCVKDPIWLRAESICRPGTGKFQCRREAPEGSCPTVIFVRKYRQETAHVRDDLGGTRHELKVRVQVLAFQPNREDSSFASALVYSLARAELPTQQPSDSGGIVPPLTLEKRVAQSQCGDALRIHSPSP